MTKIPNNVIKPPPGYEYVQQRSVPLIQPKPIEDNTQNRIAILERKLDKILDELRVLKKQQKYKPKISNKAKKIWMSDILEHVCDYFSVTPTDINSARRHAELVRVRSVYINLCHELTTASQPAIGRMCGNRDHTTVIHHIKLKRYKSNCWDIRTNKGLELWSDFSELESKLKAEAQPDNE